MPSKANPQRPRQSTPVAPANPVVTQRTQIIQREGPLPTPEELFQYDQMMPGLADRIVSMAERAQAHQANLEDMAQRADIRHRDELVMAQRETARGAFRSDLVGQVLGGFVATACVAGAVYTAIIGANPWVSIALVSLPVASIIKAIRSLPTKNGQQGK